MNDCVIWTKALDSSGYGIRMVGNRTSGTRRVAKVHRLVFEQEYGPIPAGMCVLHRCDRRACVNPQHLWLGTVGDNNRDRTEKGRGGWRLIAGERHYNALLTEADVRTIRSEFERARRGRQRVSRGWREQLAERFTVSAATISNVTGNKTWRHVLAGVLLIALMVGTTPRSWAQEVTADQVVLFISAYSARYSSADYLYVDLFRDSLRVARCESGGFDSRVLNNVRRGARGEVGTFQFLPGPRSIFWATPTAAAGWDYWDVEANVAGAVWLISRGYGPRHWSCW